MNYVTPVIIYRSTKELLQTSVDLARPQYFINVEAQLVGEETEVTEQDMFLSFIRIFSILHSFTYNLLIVGALHTLGIYFSRFLYSSPSQLQHESRLCTFGRPKDDPNRGLGHADVASAYVN